jgi:hypothetical protein
MKNMHVILKYFDVGIGLLRESLQSSDESGGEGGVKRTREFYTISGRMDRPKDSVVGFDKFVIPKHGFSALELCLVRPTANSSPAKNAGPE